MKKGNWIPLDKNLVQLLPKKNRAYEELEAIFCVSLDYDSGAAVTVSGYAALWKWSRRQVRNLLDRLGVSIIYPTNTKDKQNQSGQISINKNSDIDSKTDRSRDVAGKTRKKSGQIRLIDSKDIDAKPNRTKSIDDSSGQINGQITDRYAQKNGQIKTHKNKDIDSKADRSFSKSGQITDRYADTTIYPNNPKSFLKPIQATLTSKSAQNFCSLLVEKEIPFLEIFEKCKNLDCWKSPDQDPQTREWALEIAQSMSDFGCNCRIIIAAINSNEQERVLKALSYAKKAKREIEEKGKQVKNPTGLFVTCFDEKFSTAEMEKQLVEKRAAENATSPIAEVLDMPKHKAKTQFGNILGAVQEHLTNRKSMEG